MNKTYTIKIKFDPPPIPFRGWDWQAWDDNTLDMDTYQGRGSSPLAAIVDYLSTQPGFEDIHLELHTLAAQFSPVSRGDTP